MSNILSVICIVAIIPSGVSLFGFVSSIDRSIEIPGVYLVHPYGF